MPPPQPPPPSCPFCNIAATYPPFSLSSPIDIPPADTTINPQAHVLLSTKNVVAFLDIMPLNKGHVLVVTRDHYEKIMDLGVGVSREIGQWLPIISRVVMRTVFGDDAEWHWNVVQNNGVAAAQVVPHVHFHVVPRPLHNKTPVNFAMFGRGQRDDLDDDEADKLVRELREGLAREVKRVKEEEGVDLEMESGVGLGGVKNGVEKL